MYIHIHKYKYVNAYMLHTFYNKPYVLTDNNTCIKITYYISYNPFILHIYYYTHNYIQMHIYKPNTYTHYTHIL